MNRITLTEDELRTLAYDQFCPDCATSLMPELKTTQRTIGLNYYCAHCDQSFYARLRAEAGYRTPEDDTP